jgi:hypothetical protein
MSQQDLQPFIGAGEARRKAEAAAGSEIRCALSYISGKIKIAADDGLFAVTVKMRHTSKVKDTIMSTIRDQGYFVEAINTLSGGSQWDPYYEECLKISWGVGVNVNKREV